LRASIWKITTDAEGESKITFCVPSSELSKVVRLNILLQKELRLDINEVTGSKGKEQDQGRSDL
jgi:hypothetical protein